MVQKVIHVSTLTATYESILGEDFIFRPLLPWIPCQKFLDIPYFHVIEALTIVISVLLTSFLPQYPILGLIELIIISFAVIVESGSSYDRTLLKIVLTEFNFLILFIHLIISEYSAFVITSRENLLDYGRICDSIAQFIGFLFIFATDAAPKLTRAYKFVLLGGIDCLLFYQLLLEAFIRPVQPSEDEPICVLIKCISPRSLQLSSLFNLIMFLTNHLFQLRFVGALVLPRGRFVASINNYDESKKLMHAIQVEDIMLGTPKVNIPSPSLDNSSFSLVEREKKENDGSVDGT